MSVASVQWFACRGGRYLHAYRVFPDGQPGKRSVCHGALRAGAPDRSKRPRCTRCARLTQTNATKETA